MSPRKSRMKWFKWWIQGTLDSPLIKQLTDEEFGIRAKLLTYAGWHAGMDCPPGDIGVEGVGYSLKQLAARLHSTEEGLQSALERFEEIGIARWDRETDMITMINWSRYQTRYDERFKDETPPVTPEIQQYPGEEVTPNSTPKSDKESDVKSSTKSDSGTQKVPGTGTNSATVPPITGTAPKTGAGKQGSTKVDQKEPNKVTSKNDTESGVRDKEMLILDEILDEKLDEGDGSEKDVTFSPTAFTTFYSNTFGVVPSPITVTAVSQLAEKYSWIQLKKAIITARTENPNIPWYQIIHDLDAIIKKSS